MDVLLIPILSPLCSLKMTNSEEVHVWFQDHRIGLKRMLVNNASSYQFDFVSFIILMYNMVLLTVYREDSKVLSICDVVCLLAHESCDISKPETKISLVKSWTNTQNDNHFHSKMMIFFKTWPFWQKKIICSACNINYFSLTQV